MYLNLFYYKFKIYVSIKKIRQKLLEKMIRNNLLEPINECWSDEKSNKKIVSGLKNPRETIKNSDFNSNEQSNKKIASGLENPIETIKNSNEDFFIEDYYELPQITLKEVLDVKYEKLTILKKSYSELIGATSLYVENVVSLENKIQNFNGKKEIIEEIKNEILKNEIFNKDLTSIKKQLQSKILGENLQKIKIFDKTNFLLNSGYFEPKIYPIDNVQINNSNKKIKIYTDGSYYDKKSYMSSASGGWSVFFDYGNTIEEHFGPISIVDELNGSFICEIIAIIQALDL